MRGDIQLGARQLTPLLAALLLVAASIGGTALFRADSPGSDLHPVSGAESMVQVLQGNKTILWTALSGSVSLYRVQGWPTSVGENDLGGGVIMERPSDGTAGIIQFGEKPRLVSFELSPG